MLHISKTGNFNLNMCETLQFCSWSTLAFFFKYFFLLWRKNPSWVCLLQYIYTHTCSRDFYLAEVWPVEYWLTRSLFFPVLRDELFYLVTCWTPGFEQLSMVPATMNFSILIKIDEVDQQLTAREADKTGWVPAHSWARSRGKHCNLTSIYLQPTLKTKGFRFKTMLLQCCSLCLLHLTLNPKSLRETLSSVPSC